MKTINIELKEDSYDILIENSLLENIAEKIKLVYEGDKIAIITDSNLHKLYSEGLHTRLAKACYKVSFIVIESGEASKSIHTLEYIYNKLACEGITRTDLILAFGGGVVGDIAGFAASTYLRGIAYIQAPTSLVAQVDSSIGGKTAINLSYGKNLVGCFYHPKLVLIDTNVLNTLSEEHIKDGMAEVIKYACIEDKEFFNFLNNINLDNLSYHYEDIVYKCCSIKKKYVEADERDLGIRMKLNFGHTLGHAIEKYFDYKHYTHGQAIAIGMYNICLESEESCYTEIGTSERIRNMLINYGLEYKLPDMNMEELEKIIKSDKKNMFDRLNLIYLKRIGEANIVSKYILE
jgi:3-dehydroquinate synthase